MNEGVDMRIVSKICGHSSTRITEKVYAKLLDETVVEAIKKLEKQVLLIRVMPLNLKNHHYNFIIIDVVYYSVLSCYVP